VNLCPCKNSPAQQNSRAQQNSPFTYGQGSIPAGERSIFVHGKIHLQSRIHLHSKIHRSFMVNGQFLRVNGQFLSVEKFTCAAEFTCTAKFTVHYSPTAGPFLIKNKRMPRENYNFLIFGP
ncbi:hypothetical protein, partial [uncultured Chryseobacterium sp.]|uniref:hypothetical protein n=1 Tax=uncultured Chryseobacterium sp. TaxID=259322 RepID=UPI0025E6D3E7